MAHTLFISDLHLDPARAAITELFLEFLRTTAPRAEALYILGDLFEAWIGDDAADAAHRPVIEGLRALAAGGTPVYLMHGTRDFLVGTRFEQMSGARLLPDPSVITLYGRPALLMHGDTLCTDDVDYQHFRALVRDERWQCEFLALPPARRTEIAHRLRAASQEYTRGKKPEIMDVNPRAVERALREHGVRYLIHGHTHRPAVHTFPLDGRTATRIVLGDWYEQGSVLHCDAAGCRLLSLPLPN
ncbi:MAG: UDP-2,3-diacylglucosamine diphosphatase [Gammaproteobacteria bacterium]|nr:UDP-2,3-diacylglucosamine diphosphatase [Gammaproteobacteria bacterium]